MRASALGACPIREKGAYDNEMRGASQRSAPSFLSGEVRQRFGARQTLRPVNESRPLFDPTN